MIGTLYRYPHPHDPTRFIYVGQGPNRDKRHRLGRTSFGRRFKKMFSGVELPQPIREQIEILDYLELNELETIWMFRYHTWYGYLDGMNLVLPASLDYKNMGRLGARTNTESGHMIRIHKLGGRAQGLIQGQKNVENGLLASLRTPKHQSDAGRISGRNNVENGHMSRIRNLPQTKVAQREAGLRAALFNNCTMWHIKRGKSCICKRHPVVSI
jgi:hypothetical protein